MVDLDAARWRDEFKKRRDRTVTAAAGELLELLATKLELTADVTVDDIRPDIALETQ